MRKFAAILALCLAAAAGAGAAVTVAAAAGQSGTAATYYIFASSNRAPELTDDAARRKLSSFEETNAIAVADRIACGLAGEARISGLLGVYDTSGENSFLVEARLDRAQAEYLSALLGSYERQRYILMFSPGPEGRDQLWVIETPRAFEIVAAEARREQVTPLSVRFEASGAQVWIVDLGGKLGDKPKELAAQLGGTASLREGSAEMLGDEDDRAKTAATYRSSIQAFEQHSPLRFSASVASAEWRKASARTCSSELPQ